MQHFRTIKKSNLLYLKLPCLFSIQEAFDSNIKHRRKFNKLKKKN